MRIAVPMHRICHRKFHGLWTEHELATRFGPAQAIRAHPAMQTFIRRVAGRPAEFWTRTETPPGRRRRGRWIALRHFRAGHACACPQPPKTASHAHPLHKHWAM